MSRYTARADISFRCSNTLATDLINGALGYASDSFQHSKDKIVQFLAPFIEDIDWNNDQY